MAGLVIISAAFFSFGLPVPTTTLLTGYDCSSTTVLFPSPMINDLLPPCYSISEIRQVKADLIDITGTSPVTGYRCIVKRAKVSNDYSSSTNVILNETLPIDAETCRKAHKNPNGTMTVCEMTFSRLNLNTNGTKNMILYSFPRTPWCNSSDSCQTRVDFTLAQVSGTVDLERNVISFDNGIDCDYSDFSCDDQFGQIFWFANEINYSGPVYRAKTVTILKSRKTLTFPEEVYAIIYSRDKVYALNGGSDYVRIGEKYALKTRNGLYLVETGEAEDYRTYEAGIHFSGRYVYTEYLNDTEKHEAVEIARRRCFNEYYSWYERKVESLTNNVGHRLLWPEMGVTVHNSNTSLKVEKCAQVKVLRRETHECSENYLIPVRDEKNRNLYINTASRYVHPEKPNACHELVVPTADQTSKTMSQTEKDKMEAPKPTLSEGTEMPNTLNNVRFHNLKPLVDEMECKNGWWCLFKGFLIGMGSTLLLCIFIQIVRSVIVRRSSFSIQNVGSSNPDGNAGSLWQTRRQILREPAAIV